MISRPITNIDGLIKFLIKNVNTFKYRITVEQDQQSRAHQITLINIETGVGVWIRTIVDGVNEERYSLPDMFTKNYTCM